MEDEDIQIRRLRKRVKELESVFEEYVLRFGLTDLAREVLSEKGDGSEDDPV